MLYNSYLNLCKKFNIDTIILIDGGIDSVLFGDEKVFGSPLEDLISVVAVGKLINDKIIKGYLYCTGLYVDECDVKLFMRNISNLTKINGFVGCYSLDKQYLQDYNQLLSLTNPKSVINESIVAAIEGYTGHYENPTLKARCEENGEKDYPFINPLTASYWIVDIESLIKQSPMINEIYDNCFVKYNIKNDIIRDSITVHEIIHKYSYIDYTNNKT